MLREAIIVAAVSGFTLTGVAAAKQQQAEDWPVSSHLQEPLDLVNKVEKSKRSLFALGILMTLPQNSRREFFQALPYEVAVSASIEKLLLVSRQMELNAPQQELIKDVIALGERLIVGDIDEYEASLLSEQLELRSVELFGKSQSKKLFSMYEQFKY